MHSKKRIILKVTLLLLPASLAGTTHKRKHFPIIKIHTYLPLFPLPDPRLPRYSITDYS